MQTVLAFIFVLGIAILFHEFGHFLTAKIAGIKVFRFSLGFGPKIIRINLKDTEYVLSLLPFGGYVKMAGEMNRNENNNEVWPESDDPEVMIPDHQRFDKKSLFVRIAVIFNGPLMNILLSLALLIIVFFYSGTAFISNTISEVAVDSPAYNAGLLAGDKIIAINNIEITNAEAISKIINENHNQVITLKIIRDDMIMESALFPEYSDEYDRAMIGITLDWEMKKLTFFESVKKSVKTTGEILQLIGKGFIDMFSGDMPVELAGPLGIAQMAGEAAQSGFLNLLFFTAVINIFLGTINLFPIPILDGGQIALLAIEKIRGKPLNTEQVNLLYIIGFSFMIVIFLIATYQDILRMIVR